MMSMMAINDLSAEGLIFMAGSWGFILGLCVFCFWKVLKKKEKR